MASQKEPLIQKEQFLKNILNLEKVKCIPDHLKHDVLQNDDFDKQFLEFLVSKGLWHPSVVISRHDKADITDRIVLFGLDPCDEFLIHVLISLWMNLFSLSYEEGEKAIRPIVDQLQ